MRAYSGELPRFCVLGVVGVEDGFGRPYSNMGICGQLEMRLSGDTFGHTASSCDQPGTVGGDMAAVDFSVSQFT
jgi:hypothetical protein